MVKDSNPPYVLEIRCAPPDFTEEKLQDLFGLNVIIFELILIFSLERRYQNS